MKKKNGEKITRGGITVTISDKVKDYSNDPLFRKKDEEADRFLKKHGFPKELLKKR